MHRLTLIALAGLVALLPATPALASQCPKLIKQLEDATGQRFDATAADAKLAASRAQSLHAAGNHAESEKVAKEALAKLGIKS